MLVCALVCSRVLVHVLACTRVCLSVLACARVCLCIPSPSVPRTHSLFMEFLPDSSKEFPRRKSWSKYSFSEKYCKKGPFNPCPPGVTESFAAGESVPREHKRCCQPQTLLWAPGD